MCGSIDCSVKKRRASRNPEASVGNPKACKTAMMPRVDSETGLFSTNNAVQINSARSPFESFQYSSGVVSEERKNSASR